MIIPFTHTASYLAKLSVTVASGVTVGIILASPLPALAAATSLLPTPSSQIERPLVPAVHTETNASIPRKTTKKKLTVHNGDAIITKRGTVINRADIRGFVIIKAPNVTIKNSIIRGGRATRGTGLLSITTPGASNFRIIKTTLKPQYPSPYLNGVMVNQKGVFKKVDISGTVDGIVMYGDNTTVKDSHLHGFVTYPNDPAQGGGPSHSDAIMVQGGSGNKIIRNTLGGANNAAIQITNDAYRAKIGPLTTNLTISKNTIDNGGCSINFGTTPGITYRNLNVTNNKFGRGQRNVGCAIIRSRTAAPLNENGNVWADNGSAVRVSNGS